MIELPELGSGDAAPSVLPVLEVPDFSGSDDAEVVADDTLAASTLVAPPPSGPVPVTRGRLPSPVPVESAAAAAGEAPASDDISVGGVVLSASLFEILIAEADQHLATLRHETQLLQFDPAHPVSHEMVRASHTLCGIHRTGGFPLVAITAKALEQTLLGLQQHGGPLPSAALPVLQRAVAGLDSFLARIKERGAFSVLDADEAASIQGELEALRADLAAAVDDAETLAARRADEDDEPRVEEHAGAATPGPDADVAMEAAPATPSAPPQERDEELARRPRPRHPRRCWIRLRTCVTTSIRTCCRYSSRKRANSSRRPARRCAPGAGCRRTTPRRSSCGARSTPSRGARGWRARCAWANSPT